MVSSFCDQKFNGFFSVESTIDLPQVFPPAISIIVPGRFYRSICVSQRFHELHVHIRTNFEPGSGIYPYFKCTISGINILIWIVPVVLEAIRDPAVKAIQPYKKPLRIMLDFMVFSSSLDSLHPDEVDPYLREPGPIDSSSVFDGQCVVSCSQFKRSKYKIAEQCPEGPVKIDDFLII